MKCNRCGRDQVLPMGGSTTWGNLCGPRPQETDGAGASGGSCWLYDRRDRYTRNLRRFSGVKQLNRSRALVHCDRSQRRRFLRTFVAGRGKGELAEWLRHDSSDC